MLLIDEATMTALEAAGLERAAAEGVRRLARRGIGQASAREAEIWTSCARAARELGWGDDAARIDRLCGLAIGPSSRDPETTTRVVLSALLTDTGAAPDAVLTALERQLSVIDEPTPR